MNKLLNRRELIAAAVALGVSPQIAFGKTSQTMNSKAIPVVRRGNSAPSASEPIRFLMLTARRQKSSYGEKSLNC